MRTHLTWLRPTEADRRTRAAWPVAAIHLCILMSLWGGASPYVRAASYSMDVDYSISGSSEIAPVQVFDDGQRTYIQFPNPSRIPDVTIEHANDHSVIHYQVMAPYIVINQVVDRMVLKSAGRTVDVAYNRYRAPMLAGLPAARRQLQPPTLAAAQPLMAPVTFYADDRHQAAATRPGHYKPRHGNTTTGHGLALPPGAGPADNGPTSISVVSAAALMPLNATTPALPAMPGPGLRGLSLPALPGNVATLPELYPYHVARPIVAVNSAAAPAAIAAATPMAPPAGAASITPPSLPAVPQVIPVPPVATMPPAAGVQQAATPSAQGNAGRPATPTSSPSPAQPAAVSPLLASVMVQPAKTAAAAPAPEQAAVTQATVVQPVPVTASAAKQATPATPTPMAATTPEKPAAKPNGNRPARAETKLAQASPVTAKEKSPVTRLASATPGPRPVPALSVAGAAKDRMQAAVAAAPSKPPVRTDYTIQPGLLKLAFQQVADRYGYTLSWSVNEAKDKFIFDYPVTMAGVSFVDDLRAMDAMANTPQKVFVIDVYQANKIITVRGLEN